LKIKERSAPAASPSHRRSEGGAEGTRDTLGAAPKAVLLLTDKWAYDSYSIAAALAAWIKTVPCTWCSAAPGTDADNNQLPSRWRRCSASLHRRGRQLTLGRRRVHRRARHRGRAEVMTCKAPAVISCHKGSRAAAPT